MISFEDARAIVTAKVLPEWTGLQGTFYVADYGWENEQFYSLAVGAREYLVDGDRDFFQVDDILYLVDKKTGRYIETIAYENLDLLDSLTAIGQASEDDKEGFIDSAIGPNQNQLEFDEVLEDALKGTIRTCTGLNERTRQALERIVEACPDVTQQLIQEAKKEFGSSK